MVRQDVTVRKTTKKTELVSRFWPKGAKNGVSWLFLGNNKVGCKQCVPVLFLDPRLRDGPMNLVSYVYARQYIQDIDIVSLFFSES